MFVLNRVLDLFNFWVNCRTPCKYPGKNIAFHVNEGSTNYWLSLLVEFEDGDGDVGSMHIREVSSLFVFDFFVLPYCYYE